MGRYLINIAYIGRKYKGVQRQHKEGIKTIIETLETAARNLDPANKVCMVSSSRTDKGVNAFSNTVHVDLEHRETGTEFHPDEITSVLNRNLIREDEEIRALRTLRVRDDFHARFSAQSRTYVYRLTLSKNTRHDWSTPFNPFDYMRTYALYKLKTDLDLVRQAADILSGTHNFTGFTSYESLIEQPWINPVKTLEVSVVKGMPSLGHHFPEFHSKNFEDVEFVFKGTSFLYKQVRHMTAMMLAVGQGLVDLNVLKDLLVKPKNITKIRKTDMYKIPTYALYLKEVEYKPEDLIFHPEDDESEKQTGIYRNGFENCVDSTNEPDIENTYQNDSTQSLENSHKSSEDR